MTDKNKLIEENFGEMLDILTSCLETYINCDMGCAFQLEFNIPCKDLLTEIKGRLEQQPLPDEELVEKIYSCGYRIGARSYGNKDSQLIIKEEWKAKAEIRKLLQGQVKPRGTEEEELECVEILRKKCALKYKGLGGCDYCLSLPKELSPNKK